MSSFSELDGTILRDTTNPPLVNKGAELTYGEWDDQSILAYNAIQDIVSGENVTAYDAGATYDAYSTDVYEQYCGYDSRIWKAVYAGSPSSFSGQTPAEGAYWTQVSLAQLLPDIMKIADFANTTTAKQPKKYVALLTQTGTNAPTAIVLENTIGDIVWSRSIAGVYAGTLAGAFTVDKTVILGSLYTNITASSDAWLAVYNTADAIEVNSTSSGVLADDVLSKEYTQIQIIVYH